MTTAAVIFGAMLLLPVSAAAQATGDEPVYRAGNGVTLPKVIRQIKPHYTKAAKDAGIQGTVELECVVRKDGTPTDVRVTQSLDKEFGLDDEAVKALKQWEFVPGTKDDKPVNVRITVELTFTLK